MCKTDLIREGDLVEVKYFKTKGNAWWVSSDGTVASIDTEDGDVITLPVSYFRKIKDKEGALADGGTL